MATFAEILVKLRKEQGLTQGELAEKIGYSKATVVAWETEQRKPGKNAILRLGKFFDVKTDYLTGDDINRVVGEDTSKVFWSNEEVIESICEEAKKLNFEDCLVVYDLVRNLVRQHTPLDIDIEKPKVEPKILHMGNNG